MWQNNEVARQKDDALKILGDSSRSPTKVQSKEISSLVTHLYSMFKRHEDSLSCLELEIGKRY